MSKPKADAPSELSQRLQEIGRLVSRVDKWNRDLARKYRHVHDAGYGLAGPGDGRAGSGPGDPTFENVAAPPRDRYRAAAAATTGFVKVAMSALDHAHGTLDRALKDRGEVVGGMKADTGAKADTGDPAVGNAEFKESEAAAERRRARGEE